MGNEQTGSASRQRAGEGFAKYASIKSMNGQQELLADKQTEDGVGIVGGGQTEKRAIECPFKQARLWDGLGG
jgi:hypothetical protein